MSKSRLRGRVWECSLFVFKQGWACLFGGVLLGLVLVTKLYWPAHSWLARYDFLFLCALGLQIALLLLRMETLREAKVILVFHVVGTVMELFKTRMGAWNYPGTNLIRIGAVPLFSGFMYASVGSYMARVSRIFEMRYKGFPDRRGTVVLAFLIYANFFTHHFLPDIRWALFLFTGICFSRTWVHYKPYKRYRRMPLLVGFGLVAFFLWMAENIGTFATVWVYPQQQNGWHLVALSKYGAWYLLMIISFILVSFVHAPAEPGAEYDDIVVRFR